MNAGNEPWKDWFLQLDDIIQFILEISNLPSDFLLGYDPQCWMDKILELFTEIIYFNPHSFIRNQALRFHTSLDKIPNAGWKILELSKITYFYLRWHEERSRDYQGC